MLTTECGFADSNGVHGSDLLVQMGPTLLVDIGFGPNYRTVSRIPPSPGTKGLSALVDTGAQESCIDARLAAQPQVFIPSLQQIINGAFAGVNLQDGGQPHFALIGRTFLKWFKMVY